MMISIHTTASVAGTVGIESIAGIDSTVGTASAPGIPSLAHLQLAEPHGVVDSILGAEASTPGVVDLTLGVEASAVDSLVLDSEVATTALLLGVTTLITTQ